MIRIILVRHFGIILANVVPFPMSMFQNGKFLIIHPYQSQHQSGVVDSNLKDLELNIDQLSEAWLGRCGYDLTNKPDWEWGICNTPGALYTDYNVWLGELSDKELIDWTSCR